MVFESRGEQGAVLTTESPVLHHYFGDERSALQWIIEDKTEILRQHGGIEAETEKIMEQWDANFFHGAA
ncbi:hypothetical protein ANO14919_070320 [Xylariales sp. No.14919]|nr:hypothetical protein ANO14919_070320 [Xylariales sp. No.14919]